MRSADYLLRRIVIAPFGPTRKQAIPRRLVGSGRATVYAVDLVAGTVPFTLQSPVSNPVVSIEKKSPQVYESTIRVPAAVDWPAMWSAVAAAMDAHVRAGRIHLLTEDVLRFQTILALEDFVPDSESAIERRGTSAGGPVDLIIGDPLWAAIEFKFPRDSKTGYSPDTMMMGELLRDFYRMGRIEAPERWVAQLVNDRLRGFLLRRKDVK